MKVTVIFEKHEKSAADFVKSMTGMTTDVWTSLHGGDGNGRFRYDIDTNPSAKDLELEYEEVFFCKKNEDEFIRSPIWWDAMRNMKEHVDALPIDEETRTAVFESIAKHIVASECEATVRGLMQGCEYASKNNSALIERTVSADE